jgi:hypothetical protein
VARTVFDLNDVAVPVYALKPIATPLDTVVISGRAPKTDDEIALGPSTANVLHLGIGDTVRAGLTKKRTFRVVGTVLLWEEGGHAAYDEGGLLTVPGLVSLHPTDGWVYDFIHVRDGADPAEVDRRMLAAGAVESPTWPEPAAVRNLKTARDIPLYLGILLAMLGAGAVGYAIVATVRRRRVLDTLRAMGMSRRAAIVTLAWQATTVAIIGLAVGVPLGLLSGDLLWKLISDAVPVKYVGPSVSLSVLLVIPIALLAVNLVAVWPAWSNLRRSPAVVLRAE